MNFSDSSSVFPWKSSMEQTESAPPPASGPQNQNLISTSTLPPLPQSPNNNNSSDNFNPAAGVKSNDDDSGSSTSTSSDTDGDGDDDGEGYCDNDLEDGDVSSDKQDKQEKQPQQQQVCDCADLDLGRDLDLDLKVNNTRAPTYKDMATWTVEDDMPSPVDAYSPADSPVLGRIGRHRDSMDHSYLFDERDEYPGPSHSHSHFLPDDLPLPRQQSPPTGCFTVTSQLQSREARLYENVPTTQGELQTLGLMLFQGHSSSEQLIGHPGSFLEDPNGHHRYLSRQNTPGSGSHSHHHSSEVNFRNVNDYLGLGAGNSGGGPPSRSSWVDSGRESLSFDGESGNTANNSNSNGSSKNLLLLPPPISMSGSSGNINANAHHHRDGSGRSSNGTGGGRNYNSNGNHGDPTPGASYSPSNSYQLSNKGRKSSGKNNNMSRRERLVRQKHAIDENFQPYSLGAGVGGVVSAAATYLAVPSPRRMVGSVDHHHHLISPGAVGIPSPISLHRHPNSQQMMLQENKKSRGLISGCESPYGTAGALSMSESYTRGPSGLRLQSGRSPSRGILGPNGRRSHHANNKGGGQSFDYGELPSHQMFPNLKRHLLSGRQFSHPYGDVCNGGGGGGGNGNHSGNHNNSSYIPSHLQAQHRSFPAGLLSGVAPRSCSMGDLTSGASPGSLKEKPPGVHQTIPISSATNPPGGLNSSNVPIVTSLPLPPATSVTYEFSLAPVSGTLAPGWHLTAVQRGLATAVPLAAVVARRRIPRPRSSRPRFGFTDKSEARRAKWTIAVTALALLAMSMLLVGVTLRLAPLIDDLGEPSPSPSPSPGEELSEIARKDAEAVSAKSVPEHPVNPSSRFESSELRPCARRYSAWNEAINKAFLAVTAKQSSSSTAPSNEVKKEMATDDSTNELFDNIGNDLPKKFTRGCFSNTCNEDECHRHSAKVHKKPSPLLSGVVRSSSCRGPTSALSSSMTKLAFVDPSNRRASGGVTVGQGHGSYGMGYAYGYPSPTPTPSQSEVQIYDPLSLRRQLSQVSGSRLSIPLSRPDSIRSNKSEKSQKVAFDKYEKESVVRCSSYYRNCRSNSFAFGRDSGVDTSTPLKDLPPKERRHRKVGYAIVVVSSILLILAVLLVVISLHRSSAVEDIVRKENEDLLRNVIHHPPSTLSNVSLSSSSSSSTPSSLDTFQQENVQLSRTSTVTGESVLSPSTSDLTMNKNSTATASAAFITSPLSQYLLGGSGTSTGRK